MALTIDEVRRIAALARLRLDPGEETRLVAQLGRVVEYIDQIGSYPAAASAAALEAAGDGAEAEDRVATGLDRSRFLENAPETLDGFLVVPKVRGDGA
jgi:aspartyl-tRNA(Asn)/glutamyl-tRNA(Gln) amidotransferase subunit C